MSEGGQKNMQLRGMMLYSIRQGHFPCTQATR